MLQFVDFAHAARQYTLSKNNLPVHATSGDWSHGTGSIMTATLITPLRKKKRTDSTYTRPPEIENRFREFSVRAREAHWTESLAVGSRGYVERIQPLILSRRETDLIEEPCAWVLKEDVVPYHAKRA